MGIFGSSERDAGQLSVSRTEVKNTWSFTSPSLRPHGLCISASRTLSMPSSWHVHKSTYVLKE